MSNHLVNQTSPYLLQHKDNPVDWYPWGEEAFQKAKQEDKPIFLSVGYSTCHWCHVMAHESFEDENVAQYLNQYFVSIKVDKEERPDIDSVYMTFCQAFTGSGGWPMSVFLTPEQHPFFAGTYFPNRSRYGMKSFLEILRSIEDNWQNNREQLVQSAKEIVSRLKSSAKVSESSDNDLIASQSLIDHADRILHYSFDPVNGGFGRAPKFPTPHKLIYLLARFHHTGDWSQIKIVEKTLVQMYRGGLFDHIGYGFSRYSTDDVFLVPHFEKMLYDNALLIFAYSISYAVTGNELYLEVAKKTAQYITNQMTDEKGGFYCAQDADSQGQEGLYYLFRPDEIKQVLGEESGTAFNQWYDISEPGNFESSNIPNLLRNQRFGEAFLYDRQKLVQYRKARFQLHLDDKILTSWNGLMIGALCCLYRVSKQEQYLTVALDALHFIEKNMSMQEHLYASYREGKLGQEGFLDDYANIIFACLCLYDATLDTEYVKKANAMCQVVVTDFWNQKNGGFYLYSSAHETLILRPKETYDGAIPSGNSMMCYNLVRLCLLNEHLDGQGILEQPNDLSMIKTKQLKFMAEEAEGDPSSYAMFLIALLQDMDSPKNIVVVAAPGEEKKLQKNLPLCTELDCTIQVLPKECDGYQLLDQKTTYYVCKGHQCLPGKHSLNL